MTAIALLRTLGLGFSDVLLSKDVPGGHLELPTGNTAMFGKLQITPSSMKRKFFRFPGKPHGGMFLVAGTVSHIQHLVANIDLLRQGKSPSQIAAGESPMADARQVIERACLETEQQGYREFELLGVANGFVFVRNLDVNQIQGELNYFGEMCVGGSGGRDLYQWLAERGQEWATRSLMQDAIEQKVFRALNTLPLILLAQDRHAASRTIPNGVGGYYETYQLLEGELAPIGRVLTVFARIQGRGSEIYYEIDRLYYHRYVGDYLLVLSLKRPIVLQARQQIELHVDDFQQFEIPPLFAAIPAPGWRTSRLLGEIQGAEIFRMAITRENTGKPITIRFGESGNTRRLLDVEVRRKKVIISPNNDGFAYYLERFPTTLPADKQPIPVSW